MLPGKFYSFLRQKVGWYLFWASPWIIILLLSSVLNGYAAPMAQAPVVSSTIKPDHQPVKANPLPETTATPEVAGTPRPVNIAPAAGSLIIYLPLIVKSPPSIVCVSDIGASDCSLPGTFTPTNTPFGTPPGFGTPTNTPEPTATKPPSATRTPTVFIRYLRNGDFEDGPDVGWEVFSSGDFPVIFDEDSDDLPELPIEVFDDWAAWLGGANNEHTYIRQRVTIPRGGLYLAYNFYLQSYDVCGSQLDPPRIFDQGGIKVNGRDILFDPGLTGCTFELCEPKEIAGTWNTMYISTSFFGGPGNEITVEFWVKTDDNRPSSLFIDNVVFVNDFEVEVPTDNTLTRVGPAAWVVKGKPDQTARLFTPEFYKVSR